MSVNVEVIATLKDVNGTPLSGKQIEFYVDNVLVATATTDANGVAKITTSVAEGTHEFKAVFPGDEDYEESVAVKTVNITVNPKFDIVSVEPSSITVRPSQQFSISVVVKNIGDTEGSVEVRLKDHNNNIVAKQTTTLAPGASTTITLTAIAPNVTGTFTWTVEAYNVTTSTVDDTESITINVKKTEKRKFPWWIFILGGVTLALILIEGRKKKKE